LRGAYILLLYLPRNSIIKTKGKVFRLKKGYYAYVGSGMNSLEGRVLRHLRKDKKLHWHIDYLTLIATPLKAYLVPSPVRIEEELSKSLNMVGKVVKGFGSSDLSVPGNLFFFDKDPSEKIEEIVWAFLSRKPKSDDLRQDTS